MMGYVTLTLDWRKMGIRTFDKPTIRQMCSLIDVTLRYMILLGNHSVVPWGFLGQGQASLLQTGMTWSILQSTLSNQVLHS